MLYLAWWAPRAPLVVAIDCLQIRVGAFVYVCSTGDGNILQLSYPNMTLVRPPDEEHRLRVIVTPVSTIELARA